MVRRLLLSLWLIGAGCIPAQAAIYYVAPAGLDSRTCGIAAIIGTPKATIASGLGCLLPGDTLFIRAGTYDTNVTSVPSGTSWNTKVRVAAFPAETVWLIPSVADGGQHVIWLDCACHYIEFDGINVDGRPSGQNAAWTSTNNGNDPHHIRFQNAEMIAGTQALASGAIGLGAHTLIGATGSNELINLVIHGGGATGLCGFACASYGVYVKGPNNLIDHCDIYDTSGAGMQIYNASGDPPDNNVVRNNKIHDITRTGSLDEVWGIVILGSNNQIYNNLIYAINVGNVNPGNAGIAIALSGNKIWNNTIYNVKNSGIRVDSSAVSTVIQNNIAYLNTVTNYSDGGGTGTTHTFNLDNGTDPLFVSNGTDFHLKLGSPALNTGTTLASVLTDIEGSVRPQGTGYEMGAYEFSVGGGSPTIVTSSADMGWFWRVHHF